MGCGPVPGYRPSSSRPQHQHPATDSRHEAEKCEFYTQPRLSAYCYNRSEHTAVYFSSLFVTGALAGGCYYFPFCLSTCPRFLAMNTYCLYIKTISSSHRLEVSIRAGICRFARREWPCWWLSQGSILEGFRTPMPGASSVLPLSPKGCQAPTGEAPRQPQATSHTAGGAVAADPSP